MFVRRTWEEPLSRTHANHKWTVRVLRDGHAIFCISPRKDVLNYGKMIGISTLGHTFDTTGNIDEIGESHVLTSGDIVSCELDFEDRFFEVTINGEAFVGMSFDPSQFPRVFPAYEGEQTELIRHVARNGNDDSDDSDGSDDDNDLYFNTRENTEEEFSREDSDFIYLMDFVMGCASDDAKRAASAA